MNFFLDEQQLFIIAVVASLVSLAAIIMTLYLAARMKKFERAYTTLQTFLSGNRLEDLLEANLKEVRELCNQVSSHSLRLDQAESKLRSGIDRAELVRFNSFENMGAELSFALALLNQEGTGVVLTGIHSIEESRVYAKVIAKGKASVKLNPEEQLAIDRACKGIRV